MTKKKKGQDGDGDDDREQSRTPIRSELDKLEGKSEFPSCYCFMSVLLLICLPDVLFFSLIEKEQTPLQEALNQLIRQLQRCNVDHLLI